MQHFSLPRSLVDREQFILEACRGKKVLHLGFADHPYTEKRIDDGSWLHNKIRQVSKFCVGVDLDNETVTYLKEKHNLPDLFVGDVERLELLGIGKFEIVVAGEIIEHLNNPGLFLKSAKTVLEPGGRLIITTTNAFCARRLMRIPFGIESIHPDHVYYFSHRTLCELVMRFGYDLPEQHSYRLPNWRPILPCFAERIFSLISPNLVEGIVHVYTLQNLSDG
jgi:SAM-dependent methyltransferase